MCVWPLMLAYSCTVCDRVCDHCGAALLQIMPGTPKVALLARFKCLAGLAWEEFPRRRTQGGPSWLG